MNILFKNANVLIGNSFVEEGNFGVNGTVFGRINDTKNKLSSKDQPVVDLANKGYVVPGMLDLQLYGVEGAFFGGAPSPENLHGMEEDLLSHGVTGFLATVATNTDTIVHAAIESGKEFRRQSRGAFMGLHLEGPFLNPEKKGAHPSELIKKATLEKVKSWVEQAEGEIKMMTLAPELQDPKVIKFLNANGVVVSVGHSNATYEEASEFLRNGVTAATHLFNAMPSIHHRDPGLILAIFKQQPFASIIPDGIHVNYAMVQLAKRLLGNRLFIITDRVASSTTGVYKHQSKITHYETPDGVLSGSNLYMLDAVKNCMQHVGIPAGEAFAMATKYPAAALNLQDKRGQIKTNLTADFLILDDDFQLQSVWCKGEKMWG